MATQDQQQQLHPNLYGTQSFAIRSAARHGEIGSSNLGPEFFAHKAPNNREFKPHIDYLVSEYGSKTKEEGMEMFRKNNNLGNIGNNYSSDNDSFIPVRDFARLLPHMKSHLDRENFYSDAMSSQHWAVSEIYLSNLPSSTDEFIIRKTVRGFHCQVVSVFVDSDPITCRCKGTGVIVIRFNPCNHDVLGLMNALEERDWRIVDA